MPEKRSLSVLQIVSVALAGLSFLMLFLPWITASVTVFGQSDTTANNVFGTGGAELTSFWSVMLIILAILAIAACALGVYGVLKDRMIYVLPLPLLAVVMFLLDFFQVLFARNVLEKQLGSFSKMAAIHIGVGAWLFLIFSIGAYGVLYFEKHSKFAIGKNPGGWKCPACGAICGETQNFCVKCGAKKPEPRVCPNCGEPYKDDAFCRKCGTKLS